MEEKNLVKNEIPFDLNKDSHYLQDEVKLSDSIFIDSNNNVFVPTGQNIYVFSLKRKSFQKNWIKHFIQMPGL